MISNKYQILDKISSGSFGMVYKGINNRTNEPVAIKIIQKSDNIVFKNECLIYKALEKDKKFARLKWITTTEDYHVIVMSLLGSPIKDINFNNLNSDEIKLIAIHIFEKIDALHSYNIVHRDIKTNNFVMTDKDDLELFLIDFSFSTFTIDEYGEEKVNSGINNIIGSIYFCSLNVHDRGTPNKRDDLESACYVINDLVQGNTWRNCKYENNIITEKQKFNNNINLDWLYEIYTLVRKLDFNESININDLILIIDKST